MSQTSNSNQILDADFGDHRRTRRAFEFSRAMERSPEKSLPHIFPRTPDLVAAYRFLNNKAVTPKTILQPHFDATASAVRASEFSIIAHDTTALSFDGEVRTGMGRLVDGGMGLFAHVALALDGPTGAPLGVMDLRTHIRDSKPKRALESQRWLDGFRAVEARIAAPGQAIHVMDREADAYPLLAALLAEKCRFVIRSKHDRKLMNGATMKSALVESECFLEREIPISRRGGSRLPATRKIHPPRSARTARLSISSETLTIRRPRDANPTLPAQLTLTVVDVLEIDVPAGEKPIEWILLTTEPVHCAADAARVVDIYRRRWTIEEYFKALKSGCAIEKRQLESRAAIENMLAMSMPIAWGLLVLRSQSRQSAESPARALTRRQRVVLRAMLRVHRLNPLPPRPTARDEMFAVASLGGHIPWNGDPGWIVLGRGYHELIAAETAWAAAKGEM